MELNPASKPGSNIERFTVASASTAYNLAKQVLMDHFMDENGQHKLYLFGHIKRIARQWLYI